MSMGGGGKQPAAAQPTKALGIDFTGAQYGPPVPVVYGTNKLAGSCIWYGDFQAITKTQQQGGGKGGGGGSTTTSYDYKASFQFGICEGPITSFGTVYQGNTTTSVAALQASTGTGAIGQAPWAHLSGAAALGYSQTAWVALQNYDLGSSASLPNFNFEVTGLLPYSGQQDANPKDILNDMCTSTAHGLNFPYLGDLTQYNNYCVANGIFLSPVWNQQTNAANEIESLLKYTNSAAWFSEGQLKVMPYSDTSVTGNGVTYAPNVSPIYNLGVNDFITNGSGPPVIIRRKSPDELLNLVRVEFQDRANTYHTSAVMASMDQDVNANGVRTDDSETVDWCTQAAIARTISQNLLQRAFYIRNTYEFKLPFRYCLLEPMDVVTLTDPSCGLSAWPVRITSVEEDEHGLLTFEAEEFPEGVSHGITYTTQGNNAVGVDPNVDPGAVDAPYLFRGPGFLVSNASPEIWMALTGDSAWWAGCEVYISYDGNSYTYLCTSNKQARYGTITNTLASVADPDTTSTPQVSLRGAQTSLLGGSQTDADNLITLCMVDTEIMSYQTATLVSGTTYNLHYLRRGAYGSAVASHAANAPFVRLDDDILRVPVDPSQIGSTIHLKFLSFNIFGRTPRTLASETAYTYVVGSNVELPDVPDVPASFAVTPVADGVALTWSNDNPQAVGCTSIEYATSSTGPWTVLAQEGPTTTGFPHHFTTGATYYYRLRARGPLVSSGWSAYTSILSSTGVNVSNISNTATAAQNSAPIINPNFGTGDLTGWTSDAGTWAFQSGTAGPETGTSTYAIRTGSAGTPTDTLRNIGKIPVYAGAVVKAACSIRANGANGTCACLISWRDATGAEIHVTQGNTVTGTTLAASFATEAAPAGAIMAHAEVAAINHTTGTYTVDGFIAPILPDSLDQVPDSATRFASPLAQAIILAGNTPGGNMVPNPMFALGLLDWTAGAGWFASGYQGETIAALGLTSTATTSVLQSFSMPVAAGVALSVGLDLFAGCTFTAGDVAADIEFRNSSGAVISRAPHFFIINTTMSGFVRQTAQNIVTPANTATVDFRVFTESATGSGVLFVKRIKVERGTVCTPWNDDATQFGNQLTNAGSGQSLGDQYNAPGSLVRGYGAVRSTTALTAYSTGAVNVNAHTVTYGPRVTPYNAVSNAVTGLAVGGTYYIYTRDGGAGGSPPWTYTTSAQTANSFDDAYIGGNVTIPASGTSGGGKGGGGDAGCVGVNMFLRAGLRAKDVRWWHWLDCSRKGRRYRWHQTGRARVHFEPCVRIVAEGGAELECSIHTPFDLRDGSMTFAKEMYGREVLTDRGWRKVMDVIGLGIEPVMRIHVGGRHYAAGSDPTNRIYSHNPVK